MKRKEYKKLSFKLYEILSERYDNGALVIDNVSVYAYHAIRAFSEDKTIVRLLSTQFKPKIKQKSTGYLKGG